MGEMSDELARVKMHLGLASLTTLFGDTKLAQFSPAFKSFSKAFVLKQLSHHRVLQEAPVTHLHTAFTARMRARRTSDAPSLSPRLEPESDLC